MSERVAHIGADDKLTTTPYKDVDYGFEYGPATVERVMSDSRKGWVLIGIKTKRERMEVYVTPTGLIKVNRHAKVLKGQQ